MNIETEEEAGKSLSDYVALAKRRKRIMLITGVTLFLVGLLAAVFWPPTYRSTAIILIESQDIPPDLIRSTITSYAVQRIEEIKQRIMTTGNIMSIAQRFELYTQRELNRLTRSEISKEFRNSVSVEPISADVIDPRSGNPTKAVIAFKLAYDGDEPQKVHKVTNELITLYLNENLRGRTEQSNSTSDFLASELKSLDALLKELENKLSIFKEQNKGSLPELSSYNLNTLDRSERELIEIKTRMQDLESRKIELASQLAQLNPSAPTILPDGRAVLSDSDRLKSLQSEYRHKSAIYNADHPDLVRLNREISALLSAQGSNSDAKDVNKQLQIARDELAQAHGKYTNEHPEIKKLADVVSKLEKELKNANRNEQEIIPDNPSYVLLDTQLKSIESELGSLVTKSGVIRDNIRENEQLLLKAPAVERDYQVLLRDYDNTRLKYREISEKQMQAELGKNLEQERKGERFTLIQPPEIPEEPLSPNRIAIVFIALVLAIGLGVVAGILAEAIDPKVYGEKRIESIIGIPALVLVPFFEVPVDEYLRKKNNRLIVAGLFSALIVFVILFNFFVKPLDVTWYYLLHKLGVN
jgi:polysaccharide biosynthesis transport protein